MIQVRDYKPEVMRTDVVETVRSAFAHNFKPWWDDAAPAFGETVIDGLASFANLKLVVYDTADDKAYGALFCVAPIDFSRVVGGLWGLAQMGWGKISGRFAFGRTARDFQRELMGAYWPVLRHYPLQQPHNEIVLFAMHAKLRGQGHGRTLMDSAIDRLRQTGAPHVSLLTDSTMSWGFYKNYGYERTYTYPLGAAYRLATGSRSEEAYIYHLGLRR